MSNSKILSVVPECFVDTNSLNIFWVRASTISIAVQMLSGDLTVPLKIDLQ